MTFVEHLNNRLYDLSQHVVRGEVRQTEQCAQALVIDGVPGQMIIRQGLISGMQLIGERYRDHKASVPEILMAAKAIEAGLELLERYLPDQNEIEPHGLVILGTAQGDIHTIGKNLVGMILNKSGYAVVDLGSNVSKERFLEAVVEYQAPVVNISAMLTTILGRVVETIQLLRSRYSREELCIIVGGTAITPRFARQHDAHYAIDPFAGLEIIRRFYQSRPD